MFFLLFFYFHNLLFFFFINKSDFKKYLNIVNQDFSIPAYSINNKNNYSDTIVFSPHPYTNWSLNPSYVNKDNQKEHTIEGFKKTSNEESVFDLLKNKDSYKIICIGGSTTHCQEMDNYQYTWPSLLNNNLNKYRKVQVFNFGVGGWNTQQSLIRCVNWIPTIKPDLLVFYQAKNDLTPLVNGNLKENYIYSDYQNIITQYSALFQISKNNLLLKIPLFNLFFYKYYYVHKLNLFGLSNIYKPKAEFSQSGLKRLTDELIISYIYRYHVIFKICEMYSCKVLYIPEIVNDNVYREILGKKIFPKLKTSLVNFNSVHWFSMDELIPKNKNFFLDKMHFTKKGNKIFSKLLSDEIYHHYLSENKNEK